MPKPGATGATASKIGGIDAKTFATVERIVGTPDSTVVFAIGGKTGGTEGKIAAIGAKTAATDGIEHWVADYYGINGDADGRDQRDADRRGSHYTGSTGRGSARITTEITRDADRRGSPRDHGTRIDADYHGITGRGSTPIATWVTGRGSRGSAVDSASIICGAHRDRSDSVCGSHTSFQGQESLAHKGSVGKLAALWEKKHFYSNCDRPHSSLNGKTPMDIALSKLQRSL